MSFLLKSLMGLIVFNNEDLMNKYLDLNFFNAFEAADLEMMDIAANLV